VGAEVKHVVAVVLLILQRRNEHVLQLQALTWSTSIGLPCRVSFLKDGIIAKLLTLLIRAMRFAWRYTTLRFGNCSSSCRRTMQVQGEQHSV
jgi:hypothetical protein